MSTGHNRRRVLLQGTVLVASPFIFAVPVAAVPLNYQVPGPIPPLKQPTDMTCWATVATIMYSWRNGASFDIPSVMGKIGSTYLAMFNNNKGLSASDKPGFLLSMKLTSEAPQNYTIVGWEKLLRQHGSLWVTTAEGQKFSIHARVLTGIAGDGMPGGTNFTIVDPADGQVHHESIATFVKKFEDVARIDLGQTGELRPQVVHY